MLLVYFTKKQLPYRHFIVLLKAPKISLDIQVENRVTVFLGILILNRR